MLAEHVTPAAINFMAREARGLICLPLGRHRVRPPRACSPQVEQQHRARMGTAFTVSIEAAHGRHDRHQRRRPGAHDPRRLRSRRRLRGPGQPRPRLPAARARRRRARPRRPDRGHRRPRAPRRRAHPAGVICEIMNDDGTMARMPELEVFAARHGLKICTIADLIAWRRRNERLIEPVEMDVPLPTRHGTFVAHLFRSKSTAGRARRADASACRDPASTARAQPVEDVVTVRVHSECLTGDVFDSLRCDCGPQLDQALEHPRPREPRAVLVYLRQEGTRHRAREQARAPTACRTRASTRSRPTRPWASRPTCASTGSAPRSSTTSGAADDASSPTTRRRSHGLGGLRPGAGRPAAPRDHAQPQQCQVLADETRQARPLAAGEDTNPERKAGTPGGRE